MTARYPEPTGGRDHPRVHRKSTEVKGSNMERVLQYMTLLLFHAVRQIGRVDSQSEKDSAGLVYR